MDNGEAAVSRIKGLGLADVVINVDATKPIDCLQALQQEIGALADLTINCVNIPKTEMASILCTRDGGTVYFSAWPQVSPPRLWARKVWGKT